VRAVETTTLKRVAARIGCEPCRVRETPLATITAVSLRSTAAALVAG